MIRMHHRAKLLTFDKDKHVFELHVGNNETRVIGREQVKRLIAEASDALVKAGPETGSGSCA